MRISRSFFWIAAAIAATVAMTLFHFGYSADAAKIFAPFLGVAATGRLNDLGRTSKWLLVPLMAGSLIIVAGIAGWVSQGVMWDMYVALGIACAAWLVVLGLIPGQPGTNRYGPAIQRRGPIRYPRTR